MLAAARPAAPIPAVLRNPLLDIEPTLDPTLLLLTEALLAGALLDGALLALGLAALLVLSILSPFLFFFELLLEALFLDFETFGDELAFALFLVAFGVPAFLETDFFIPAFIVFFALFFAFAIFPTFFEI